MNRRSLLMGVALLVSAWLAFFGSKPESNDIIEPVVRKSGNAGSSGNSANPVRDIGQNNNRNPVATDVSRTNSTKAGKPPAPTEVLALQDREMLFGAKPPPAPNDKAGISLTLTERLFESQSFNPPPPPPPIPGPPPPPVAPPLPFTLLGKKLDDDAWEVYLARGEQTFIVREKTILDGNYRVESITPPTMTLTYIPLNQTQTLTIGGID